MLGIPDEALPLSKRSGKGGRTAALPTQATSMDEFYDLEAANPKRLEKKIRHCLGKLVEYEHWANIRGTFTGGKGGRPQTSTEVSNPMGGLVWIPFTVGVFGCGSSLD